MIICDFILLSFQNIQLLDRSKTKPNKLNFILKDLAFFFLDFDQFVCLLWK